MGELARVLALIAFVALLVAFVLFLQRASVVLGDARGRQRFRRSVTDLVRRAGETIGELADKVDGVRRGSMAAGLVAPDLEAAAEAMTGYGREAEALPATNAGAREVREGIAAELGRAARAIGLIEHGVTILAVSRRATGRELEAQTSIKRGYLGLLHAREALDAHAARAVELATPPQRPGALNAGPRSAGVAASPQNPSSPPPATPASSGIIPPDHKG